MDRSFTFSKYKERVRKEFLAEISNTKNPSAKKLLVWDPKLRESLKTILNTTQIENESTTSINISSFESFQTKISTIVFILRSKVEVIDTITSLIEIKEAREKSKSEYYFIFIPRVTPVCRESLDSLLADVDNRVTSFPLYFFPKSPFVLSMEENDAFKSFYLEKNNSLLLDLSGGLGELMKTYGGVGEVFGKGPLADVLAKMLAPRSLRSQINSMIIFERPSDLVSCLMTQLTYEGIFDECKGSQTNPSKTLFDYNDPVYSEIAGKSFNAVGQHLSRRSKQLNQEYERGMTQDVAELKEFTSKIESVLDLKNSLTAHISAAEVITNFVNDPNFRERIAIEQEFVRGKGLDRMNATIEDQIIAAEDFVQTLRLVCLQSVCHGGFDSKLLHNYKRELIQTYGFGRCFLTLNNLSEAGLLAPKRRFSVLSVSPPVENVDELSPEDPCYVFAIFTPIIAKLAQSLIRNRSLELLKSLPGPNVLYSSSGSSVEGSYIKRSDSILSSISKRSNASDPKVVLVVFLGGVTHAEIAALRFMSTGGIEFVVATTHIINGNDLISSMMEEVTFNV